MEAAATDASVLAETLPVRALIAAHGQFAVGIVSAVEQITGRGAMLKCLSNRDLCLDDIQSALGQALDETGAQVIFTDLPAGSCTMAVRRLLRARPEIVLITGINLSLLLDFVMQDDVEPHEAARAALERGRASMVVYGA